MTAVPAQAAGVQELAIVAPPTKFGAYNHDLLATCHELGVSEVYRMGGRPGRGRAWPMASRACRRSTRSSGRATCSWPWPRRYVFGEVDIDSIAGPSEVVVIADETTPAGLCRGRFDRPGRTCAGRQCPDHLDAAGAWNETAEELDAAIGPPGARRSGPAEPGSVWGPDPGREPGGGGGAGRRDWPRSICTSPRRTPRTGSSASRTPARSFSGLIARWRWAIMRPGRRTCCPPAARPALPAGCRAVDFLRGNSVIAFSEAGLRRVADDVRAMADKEGLTAHRASVDVRLGKK